MSGTEAERGLCNLARLGLRQELNQLNPPTDQFKLVYYIFMVHGTGVFIPWNMFINAKSYFVEYKLSFNYTGQKLTYDTHFVNHMTLASQIPSLLFSWVNVFIQVGGGLTTRIVWSIFAQLMLFILTIILGMTDTSQCPGFFFWITMITVVLISTASAFYENCIYGIGARLPPQFIGALVVGTNVCGTFTSVINLLTTAMAPHTRTAGIYYFLTALFVLVACFDTYLALPLVRFYRYNEYMFKKKYKEAGKKISHLTVFLECKDQLLNVFMTYFVTLAVFPAMHSDIHSLNKDFIISPKYYVGVMCFLTFNVTALIGSLITRWLSWPGPQFLWILVWLRLLFIPFFFFCNFVPVGLIRTIPVIITNDWIFWIGGILSGLSYGYCSSIAMMSVTGIVEPKHGPMAGMFGGAVLITGCVVGLFVGLIFPELIR